MGRILVLRKRDLVPKHIEQNFNVLDVDVTSHSKNYGRELSPFLLGDCPTPCGRVARNMENAWQYLKVYKDHLNSKSNIKKSWWEWSSEGFARGKADRYPMGKGAAPLFSFCNGERLLYTEARKRLYFPMYAKLAMKTKAYKILESTYDDEENFIILRDFDAYNHVDYGLSWDQVIHNERLKMGHGFVLAMMLDIDKNFHRFYEV